MPVFSSSDIIFLGLIVVAFAAFTVTLLYFSISSALSEGKSRPTESSPETTAARRVSSPRL